MRRTCPAVAAAAVRRPMTARVDELATLLRHASRRVGWPGAPRGGPGTRSDPLDRHRDRAAAAEAQRRQPVAALPPLQLVDERRHDPRAAGADRVAQRDRAAVDVDLLPVEPELAAVGQRLGGERLVDLDRGRRPRRASRSGRAGADALDRGEEEPLGRDLGLGVADDPGERLQPVAARRRARWRRPSPRRRR